MTTRTLNLEIPSGPVDCRVTIPEDGTGPGLLVIAGTPAISAELAEEGYVVLAPDMAPESITGAAGEEAMADAARALRALPEHSGRVAAIGFGWGGALACRGAGRAELAAVVAYDFDGAPADAAVA